eukprot:c30211_g1_i1 orf=205-663(+)
MCRSNMELPSLLSASAATMHSSPTAKPAMACDGWEVPWQQPFCQGLHCICALPRSLRPFPLSSLSPHLQLAWKQFRSPTLSHTIYTPACFHMTSACGLICCFKNNVAPELLKGEYHPSEDNSGSSSTLLIFNPLTSHMKILLSIDEIGFDNL